MPVAEAGSPKSVPLPDSVVVTDSGTDADGNVVAYLWSQVSGPNNSIIVNPGSTSINKLKTRNQPSMVGSMVNNNANYGFYFRLQNEVSYNSRLFVGSRNTTYPDKHPKLEITYQ